MGNHLYNGIELPALPDSDKPYAIIMGSPDLRNTYLYFSSSPVAYGDVPYYSQNGEVVMYLYDSGEWTGLFGSPNPTVLTLEAGDTPPNGNELLWTNHDILNEDGSVYLAASDPIPVTTAAPIDPTAFMQGWLVELSI